VAIAKAFERFYNFLANMGLVLRDDPPKVIDMTGREWGETADGLNLSVREIPKQDTGEQPVLSVVIRNTGNEARMLTVPDWLFFFQVHVVAPDDSNIPLTAYGRQLLKPERSARHMEITLGPGDAKETDIPVAALYEMRARGNYRVRVSCRVGDAVVLRSNEAVVEV
jgi:hypothetical protein